MIPLVTTLVQITDGKQSLRDATNIKRLTILALLFVPLSFVASLLSINDGVSAHGLWLLFSVAVPLCLGVALVASAPAISLNWLVGMMGRLRKR
jgi:Mg2+ and Co2+ transporter CorA